jgi:hypothetical protein
VEKGHWRQVAAPVPSPAAASVIGAGGVFLERLVAVTLEHELCRPQYVDLGHHAAAVDKGLSRHRCLIGRSGRSQNVEPLGGNMTRAPATAAIEACLVDLFQHLGIAQGHIAAGGMVRGDWYGFATRHSQWVASLTLISPTILDAGELDGLASRLLVMAGDQGRTAQGATKLLADLPHAASHILRGYEHQPWSDVIADFGTEIGPAMLDFLDRVHRDHPVAATALPEGEGEVAGISYLIRGAGPPLVLFPLGLAPSQWEPMISQLSARYCTINLGGPALGMVALLEGRGRSAYLGVVRALLDAVRVQPGEVILEVGCG